MDWINDIEIIQGQDGYYWLYSNKRDKYTSTNYHIKYITNDDLIARVNQEGIDDRSWRKDLPFS